MSEDAWRPVAAVRAALRPPSGESADNENGEACSDHRPLFRRHIHHPFPASDLLVLYKHAMREKSKILVILGPTASGKSGLAVALAKKFDGEVVSADSRQVYRGLDIGTGKITKRETRGVRHHLLDVASPKRAFTVAQYQKLARRALRNILRHGKLPIVCGGTGLYIDALLHNTAFPAVPPNLKLRRELEKESAEKLFARLRKLDPRRAETIDRHNKRRLIRALEIVLTTGKSIPRHSNILQNVGMFETLKIGVGLPKEELRKRINARIQNWLRHGLLREVKNLRKSGLSWKRLDELGLEYRYPALYLQGKISREEMIRKMEVETWRYAKRQMTWFKRDKEIIWTKNKKEAISLASNFLAAGQ